MPMHSLAKVRAHGTWLIMLLSASLTCCSAGNSPGDASDTGTVALPDTRDEGVRDTAALPDEASDTGTTVTDTGTTAMDAAVMDSDLTPDNQPDGSDVVMDVPPAMLTVGATARVTADSLNLRQGPGTTNPVITTMACGSQVRIVGGPSGYWWNVQFNATTGWASGNYLVPDAQFDPNVCMHVADAGPMGTDAATTDAGPVDAGATDTTGIFQRARLAVGYSYYWGHGSWRSDGMMPGSCSGSCPSCSHTGIYGADCSGFVAKVWQIPTASPLTTDLHPYSTYNFYNETTHWTAVPRTQIQPADALVYNANGAGHIMLFESGSDPWGNIWTFEARGCATGVVHNLRVAGTMYNTIRRNGP